ncbi:MAG: DNA translocase FtsK 4TM domain-containing protein [Anaerolineae bacterium]|nr:DNA translocase FtsK 4TM domain-containing protein [Anaerolineae bacterium]
MQRSPIGGQAPGGMRDRDEDRGSGLPQSRSRPGGLSSPVQRSPIGGRAPGGIRDRDDEDEGSGPPRSRSRPGGLTSPFSSQAARSTAGTRDRPIGTPARRPSRGAAPGAAKPTDKGGKKDDKGRGRLPGFGGRGKDTGTRDKLARPSGADRTMSGRTMAPTAAPARTSSKTMQRAGAAPVARAQSRTKPLPEARKTPRVVNRGLDLDRKLDLIGVGLVVLGGIMLFGILPSMSLGLLPPVEGGLTGTINRFLSQLFGWGKIAWPILCFAIGIWLMLRYFGGQMFELDYFRIVGTLLLYAGILTWVQMIELVNDPAPTVEAFRPISRELAVESGQGGGWFGHQFYLFLLSQLGDWGTFSALIGWIVVGLMLTFDVSVVEIGKFVGSIFLMFRLGGGDREAARAAKEAASAETVAVTRPGERPAPATQIPLAPPPPATAAAVPASAPGQRTIAPVQSAAVPGTGADKAQQEELRPPPLIRRRNLRSESEPEAGAPKPATVALPVPGESQPPAASTDQQAKAEQPARQSSRRRLPHLRRSQSAEESDAQAGEAAGNRAVESKTPPDDEATQRSGRLGLLGRRKSKMPGDTPDSAASASDESVADEKQDAVAGSRRPSRFGIRRGLGEPDVDDKAEAQAADGKQDSPSGGDAVPGAAAMGAGALDSADQNMLASRRPAPRSPFAQPGDLAADQSEDAAGPSRGPLIRRPGMRRSAGDTSDVTETESTGGAGGLGGASRRGSSPFDRPITRDRAITPETAADEPSDQAPAGDAASRSISPFGGPSRRDQIDERTGQRPLLGSRTRQPIGSDVIGSDAVGASHSDDERIGVDGIGAKENARPALRRSPFGRQLPGDEPSAGSVDTPDTAGQDDARLPEKDVASRGAVPAKPGEVSGARASFDETETNTDTGDKEDGAAADAQKPPVRSQARALGLPQRPGETGQRAMPVDPSPGDGSAAPGAPGSDGDDAASDHATPASKPADQRIGPFAERGTPKRFPLPHADAAAPETKGGDKPADMQHTAGDDTPSGESPEAAAKPAGTALAAEKPAPIAEIEATPKVGQDSPADARPAGRIIPERVPRSPQQTERAGISPAPRVSEAPPVRPASTERRAQPRSAQPVAAGANAPQVRAKPPAAGTNHYELPDFRKLLRRGDEQRINDEILLDKARVIEDTLESFGAPGKVVEVNPGPVITQFGIEPDFLVARSGKRTRVKVGSIARLDADLALALAARTIRIEAPVPGKGFVGIEVPNDEVALVGLYDIMDSPEFRRIDSKLRLALGLGVDGTPVSADLTAMPHLLIAGTTGSGKSVCVNAIISALLLSNTPDDVQFIMVDPKRVELTGYNGIPHLVAPVVVDLERIVGVLQWVQREMEERYRRFAAISARNILDYNGKIGPNEKKMPYYVVVVDELADLMMLAPDETERLLARLAQMARATGIHLIISTQRPSVDIITGLIKANFPARIAFAVASSVDSRVVLDQPGAEKLLGRGDMLYQSPDAAAPLRMQGVFVSDEEIFQITSYWKGLILDKADASGGREALASPSRDLAFAVRPPSQVRESRQSAVKQQEPAQHAFWDDSGAVAASSSKENGGGNGEDDLYDEAIELVQRLNKASVSLLQRRLRIGYTRAARLIDMMERDGIVGPAESGSKPREVIRQD